MTKHTPDWNEDATCPFCKDDGFDLIGLKKHFQRGWCDAFNDIPVSDHSTKRAKGQSEGDL